MFIKMLVALLALVCVLPVAIAYTVAVICEACGHE